ncbi:MAG: squalene/phytoene synthase family protein, partial [Candidatus Tectomicrobia bacterium]|nr:squalene/phytoene synthase family protein [Candidatus Tectomicrobia bacterium]
QLLVRLQDCFDLYDRLTPGDRCLVSNLVATLTQGMEMDLVTFPVNTSGPVQALPDRPSLERYTYYVAGVVGEFWTMLCEANLPAVTHPATLPQRRELARRFGQGLQLTNILKDLGKDLQSGRCYLPADELQEAGLHARDLLHTATLPRIRPLIFSVIQDALEHLDYGVRYVQLLPKQALRVRLSCMWPLLFAVKTLEEVSLSKTLLCGRTRVKISRRTVYYTMLRSLWYLAVPGGFARRYARQRQRLIGLMSLRNGHD